MSMQFGPYFPCHVNFSTGNSCCGIFNVITEDSQTCNECGEELTNVLDKEWKHYWNHLSQSTKREERYRKALEKVVFQLTEVPPSGKNSREIFDIALTALNEGEEMRREG